MAARRSRLSVGSSVLAILAGLLCPPAARIALAADAPPALSEDGYWRCWYRYGWATIEPVLFASDGGKYTNPLLAKRLAEQQAKGRPALGIGEGPSPELWDNGPPPEGWMQPAFDEATWPRCRKPDWLGRGSPKGSFVRGGCFRAAFEITDPAAAGEVKLEVVYRGGARVFVNGKEVARGHLAVGELAADANPESYPPEAYLVADDEFTAAFPKKGPAVWPEVPDPEGFEKCEPGPTPDDAKAGRKLVSRRAPGIALPTVQRLSKLRDRTLGPLIVPKELLKKGRNVLAIEFRSAEYHPAVLSCGIENGSLQVTPFSHGMIRRVRLTGDGPASALVRPGGVQVWVEDMHERVFSTEYLPAGEEAGRVAIVAARNGTYSAQVVVGTDRALTGLKAAAGELRSADGKVLPAAAWTVSIMGRHPVGEMLAMGIDDYDHKPDYQVRYAIARHGLAGQKPGELFFFDRLGREKTGAVPADSCQPIWLSLKVPADAAPGTYNGSVTVQADEVSPVTVPVEVEIANWRLPDPKEFATVVGAEQSPYGLARQYKVELWSDRHFELMGESFRQTARLGNDWLFIPVLSATELGNRADSPIKWVRKADGTLRFDYAVMDRYIDLATKHLGPPRVICFLIAHGNPLAASEVQVFDEKTGKAEPLNLGVDHMEDTPLVAEADKAVWKRFIDDLLAHMKERKLDESVYWGFPWDADVNQDFKKFVRSVAPAVGWARAGHYASADDYYKAVLQTYGFHGRGDLTARGWACPTLSLANSRRGWFAAFVGCAGVDTPFLFRQWPEQTLSFGQRGIGRIGVDYWGIWREGCEVLNMAKARGRTKGTVGYAINSILWPGPDGPESSARMEALVEGLQQAEARVAIERALDGGKLPAVLAKRAAECLARRNRATGTIISSSGGYQNDYSWQGWRERSRELYRLVAEVAAAGGATPATSMMNDE